MKDQLTETQEVNLQVEEILNNEIPPKKVFKGYIFFLLITSLFLIAGVGMFVWMLIDIFDFIAKQQETFPYKLVIMKLSASLLALFIFYIFNKLITLKKEKIKQFNLERKERIKEAKLLQKLIDYKKKQEEKSKEKLQEDSDEADTNEPVLISLEDTINLIRSKKKNSKDFKITNEVLDNLIDELDFNKIYH